MSERIYCDHNASSPMLPAVRDVLISRTASAYANPDSAHAEGRAARREIENARQAVAELIGAPPRDVFFTSGGTESNNLAVLGSAQANGKLGSHVITSAVEHPSVLRCFRHLEESGLKVTYLPVSKDGFLDPNALETSLCDDTILVSLMLANNETGSIQPLEQCRKVLEGRHLFFHTDAVQAVGRIDVDVDRLGVDALSLSAHKLGGPQGIGALYLREGTPMDKRTFGGMQERDRRPGTTPTALVAAFGEAARQAADQWKRWSIDLGKLRDQLEARIRRDVSGVHVNGVDPRLPNTTNLAFDGVDGETLVASLDLDGVSVSTGSACSTGALEPSEVLMAMGLSGSRVKSSIRLSLGPQNRVEELKRITESIERAVTRIRNASLSQERVPGNKNA